MIHQALDNTKFTKEEVDFQHPGMGADHCGNCVNFIPDSGACKIVFGWIASEDWCKKFKARTADFVQDAGFKESEHPRVGSGSSKGGQFTSGGGGGGGTHVAKFKETDKGFYDPEAIFGHGPELISSKLEALSKKRIHTTKSVDLDSLIPTQEYIGKDKVDEIANHYNPQIAHTPRVVQFEGKNYLLDGHHSVAAQAKMGKTEIKVLYYPELKPFEQAQKEIVEEAPKVKHELASYSTAKKIYEFYSNGMSTGAIAKELGHEATPETRKKIRAILRKAGLYKENGGLKPQEVQLSAPEHVKNLVLSYYQLQKEHGDKSVPLEKSKALFDKYFQTEGVSSDEKKQMEGHIQSWTGSVHNAGGLALRRIAADYYGRDKNKEYVPSGYASKFELSKAEEFADESKKALLAAKKYAEAYAVQAKITTVYRGMSGEVAKKIREAINAGQDPEISANALSSWTTNPATARKFAHDGVVITRKVDPKDVWAIYKATPWLFSSHYHESEIIMGHPKHVEKIPKDQIELLPTTVEKLASLQSSLKGKGSYA